MLKYNNLHCFCWHLMFKKTTRNNTYVIFSFRLKLKYFCCCWHLVFQITKQYVCRFLDKSIKLPIKIDYFSLFQAQITIIGIVCVGTRRRMLRNSIVIFFAQVNYLYNVMQLHVTCNCVCVFNTT